MGRKKSNPNVIGVNIGKLMAAKMEEMRISQAGLTRKLKRNHQSIISQMLKRKSMQAYLLWELSIAMNYDFFRHISEELIDQNPSLRGSTPSAQNRIAALEKELEQCRSENAYLKKAIDALAK